MTPIERDLTASLAREREADAANRELLCLCDDYEADLFGWQVVAWAALAVLAADVACRVLGW